MGFLWWGSVGTFLWRWFCHDDQFAQSVARDFAVALVLLSCFRWVRSVKQICDFLVSFVVALIVYDAQRFLLPWTADVSIVLVEELYHLEQWLFGFVPATWFHSHHHPAVDLLLGEIVIRALASLSI
jgi:hypothetical protein